MLNKMKMLDVFIIYIIIISFFVYKSDRIYLNISKDSYFMYFDKFKRIVRLSLLLEYFSIVTYTISMYIEQVAAEITNISYFLFVLGNLLLCYGFQYITCKKRFPNAKKTTIDEKTIIYGFVILIYAIGFGIYYLFF